MNFSSQWIQRYVAKVAVLFIVLIGIASIIGSGEDTGGGTFCCGFEVSTVTNTNENQRPVASAGSDQLVVEGSMVTLVHSSYDPDGHIASVTWSQESGPIVTLKWATFTAPMVDMRTELRFRLMVRDDFGAQGWDRVTVAVDPDPNINPVAGFIDFEKLPNGELTTDFDEISSDYSSGCVEFRNFVTTDSSRGPEYRKTGGPDNTVAWDNDRTFNPPPETNFNITVDFTVPVSSIQVDVIADVGETITMTVLDSSGSVLGAVTSVESTACCDSTTDTIGLSEVGEIATVLWETSAPRLTVPRIDNLGFQAISGCEPR